MDYQPENWTWLPNNKNLSHEFSGWNGPFWSSLHFFFLSGKSTHCWPIEKKKTKQHINYESEDALFAKCTITNRVICVIIRPDTDTYIYTIQQNINNTSWQGNTWRGGCNDNLIIIMIIMIIISRQSGHSRHTVSIL